MPKQLISSAAHSLPKLQDHWKSNSRGVFSYRIISCSDSPYVFDLNKLGYHFCALSHTPQSTWSCAMPACFLWGRHQTSPARHHYRSTSGFLLLMSHTPDIWMSDFFPDFFHHLLPIHCEHNPCIQSCLYTNGVYRKNWDNVKVSGTGHFEGGKSMFACAKFQSFSCCPLPHSLPTVTLMDLGTLIFFLSISGFSPFYTVTISNG